MPRKAKDKLINEQELNNEIVEKIAKKEKKVTTSKSTTKKSTKPTTKTTKSKKTSTENTTKNTKKASSKNAEQTSLKAAKVAKTNKTAKETTKKRQSSKSKNAKSTDTVAKTSSRKPRSKKSSVVGEYYDLPTNYNETIVKILAQTPTILFVYWDISEEDKQNLIKQFGENFFMATSPFLVVKNRTKNYEFEVEVNDYANSWYLHIPDSDCQYEVTLIRKAKNFITNSPMNYVTIRSSNELQTPNDHILFERLSKTVFFQDVKTKMIQKKNISSFAFMHNMGRIYHIYDLYKEMYQNELKGDELGTSLSSSQFSSTFK